MAQTTSALAAVNTKIEVSTNGSTWTDISGSTNSIDPKEQKRQSGEAYTLQGDTAIITSGKREPLELAMKIIYTETTGEAFQVLRAVHETSGGQKIYVRWAVKGGNSGDTQYTSDPGVMTGFEYPKGQADEAKPVMVAINVKVPKVTAAVLP